MKWVDKLNDINQKGDPVPILHFNKKPWYGSPKKKVIDNKIDSNKLFDKHTSYFKENSKTQSNLSKTVEMIIDGWELK